MPLPLQETINNQECGLTKSLFLIANYHERKLVYESYVSN